jgi:hypothetical protein
VKPKYSKELVRKCLSKGGKHTQYLGVARRRSSFGNGEEGLLFLGQGIVK